MTVTLDYEEATDTLRLHASPRDREKIKSIPGARHDHATQTWKLYPTWGTALALRAEFGAELTLTPAAHEWGLQMRNGVEQALLAKLDNRPVSAPWGAELFSYQAAAVRFMTVARKVLLGDDMGVGKTIEAIGALHGAHQMYDMGLGPSPWPALIVCTNTMLYKWAAEIQKWAPDVEVHVATGTAVGRRKAMEAVGNGPAEWPSALVIGWPTVWRHSRQAPYPSVESTEEALRPKELDAIGFGTVIADEAHRMLGHTTKQTRALWNLMHQAEYAWALTGTPITGRPETLWSVMHGLAPQEYPARTKFIERYILSWKNYFGGLETAGFRPDHRDEFFGFFDARFLRRSKDEVLPFLPPKVYTDRTVAMTTGQAKAYREMKKHLMTLLEDGTLVSAPNPLDRVGKLLQYAAFQPDGDGQVVSSCKVDALSDILDEAGGQQLVVFVYHRALADAVEALLIKRKITYGRITGQEQPFERYQAETDFQSGTAQVIVCSLGAGSESITLTAARTAVFLQRSWRMDHNMQAEDRLRRFGQEHETVEIIDVVTEGTVEDDVHVSQAVKEGNMQAVVRDPGWLAKVLR